MIFWDLDGPILDVSDKYYSVYRDILLEKGEKPLQKKEYWDLKRAKVSVKNILLKTNSDSIIKYFEDLWLSRIETKNYQQLDKLQYNIKNILGDCTENNRLVLVTLRRSRKMLLKQLNQLRIIQYFEDILSSGVNIRPRWKIKDDLIKKYIGQENSDDHILIGDTETDIEAGKHLNFQTMAISNGIRNEKILKQSKPDYIYSSISEFYTHYVLGKIL